MYVRLCGYVITTRVTPIIIINMSVVRTIGTRESAKGASISTSQSLKSPLSNEVLLSFPDPRLTIGAMIPIPFEENRLIPYVGDNTFGRRKRRLCDVVLLPDERSNKLWCPYCNCASDRSLKHRRTVKCQASQKLSRVLPKLTNVRSFFLEQNCLIEREVPGLSPFVLSPPVSEWVERFDVMSQIAIKGLPVDFGFSDFLLTDTRIPQDFHDYCALQTRTGSYLEALLLSVSSVFLSL